MNRHLHSSALIVVLSACGPGTSKESTGADGSDGTSDGTESSGAASTSTSTGSSGQDGSSSGDTGIACMALAEYFVPGCGDPALGNAVIEPGCYEPCSEEDACSVGFCAVAWIDPCYGSPCGACGGEQGLCLEGLPTGAECRMDAQCLSGVCWDFNAYDECCGGTVCSGTCETDRDCLGLAQAAGAPNPEGASCGVDGRCDLVGTGLGSFVCAGGGPMCG
jgi:hypothetical protein